MIQTETPAGVDSYQDGTCDYAAIRERTDLTDSNPVPATTKESPGSRRGFSVCFRSFRKCDVASVALILH
jgi:hypothetical protein